MFPEALNYFAFVVALLCAAPLVIGLYHYIRYVIGVFYHCNDTVSRIERKLKAIEDMERYEEKVSRPPPPHLYGCIRECKVDFENLRGRSENIGIRQSPLQLASTLYHMLRGDAAVCRLLKLEDVLGRLLDKWKEKSDLASMMDYGGHLLKQPASTAGPVETAIQNRSLPALQAPKSVPESISPATLPRLAPQTEQPAQCSPVDNESDLESSSGSEAGSATPSDSQVDTDREILPPLRKTLRRSRSLGSRRPLRRKQPALNEAEDDREYLTMYTSNPGVSPCSGDGSPKLSPSDLSQRPRLHTGGAPQRPPVITEGITRGRGYP